MQKLILVSIAGLVLVVSGVNGHAQNDERGNENSVRLAQLKRDRAATAKNCFEAHRAAYDAQTITLDRLLMVAEKLRDAELEIADGDESWLKALQANLDRVRQIDKKIQALKRHDAVGGEAEKAHLSELAVQEAEIAVLSEMAKDQ